VLDVLPAKRLILATQPVGVPVAATLSEADGLLLAADVIAPISLPRFDNSAMDGYAVCAEDCLKPEAVLKLVGETWAGREASPSVLPGTCVRIMTGARLPEGATAVVMKENCRVDGDKVLVSGVVKLSDNIRRAGEEIEAGILALPKGTRLNAGAIGFLSGLGVAEVFTYSRPIVSLIVTGSELAPAGTKLTGSQIYESNSAALAIAIRETGAILRPPVIVPDEPEKIRQAIDTALAKSSHVLLCGGVSVGEHDHNKRLLSEAGVQTIFWKIAQKPGKPLYFGERRGVLVFGLPGNPVSALVCYYEYVRAALLKFQNRFGDAEFLEGVVGGVEGQTLTARQKKYFLPNVPAFLTETLKKKPGLTHFVRARAFVEGRTLRVSPVDAQGSHMMGGFARANAILVFPKQSEKLEEGTLVNIHMLPGEAIYDGDALFFW